MKLLIFRTNIKSRKRVKDLKVLLNNHSDITNWTIDIEDIDNVLKIEVEEVLTENEIIEMLSTSGHFCEVLAD